MAVDGEAWARYRRALAGETLPVAFVDLDAVDANVDRLLAPARAAGKRVRIATKSLRCPALVGRVAARGGGAIHGLMTYTAGETAFFAGDGAALVGAVGRDLVLAYPTVQPGDVARLADANRARARGRRRRRRGAAAAAGRRRASRAARASPWSSTST